MDLASPLVAKGDSEGGQTDRIAGVGFAAISLEGETATVAWAGGDTGRAAILGPAQRVKGRIHRPHEWIVRAFDLMVESDLIGVGVAFERVDSSLQTPQPPAHGRAIGVILDQKRERPIGVAALALGSPHDVEIAQPAG